MWFLIKGTFWFSMVLVLLSYFGKPEDTELAAAPGIEIGDAIAAATGAYSYIASICVEKARCLRTGAETLTALGQRAKAAPLSPTRSSMRSSPTVRPVRATRRQAARRTRLPRQTVSKAPANRPPTTS